MANIKQQKKRNLQNERNRQRNVSIRSRMKTFIKQAQAAIDGGDTKQVEASVKQAIQEIDKAASKGVIHANTAARKKARLQKVLAPKS